MFQLSIFVNINPSREYRVLKFSQLSNGDDSRTAFDNVHQFTYLGYLLYAIQMTGPSKQSNASSRGLLPYQNTSNRNFSLEESRFISNNYTHVKVWPLI